MLYNLLQQVSNQQWWGGVSMRKISKYSLFIFLLGILVIAGCSSRQEQKITGNAVEGIEKITIYRSNSCGCCSLYSNYVKNKGNNVEDMIFPDITFIKSQYGIPLNVQSCHTSIIGKYFVEGHIPLEAVSKLMNEQPDILGIGMPGMPSGSPGMPGAKQGDFVVFGVNKDGSTFEFMRL